MKNKLYLSIGMPRAGSGWYYNLMHDLVVAGGGKDAREIRRRFLLQPVLTEINCNISVLSTPRVLLAIMPVLLGNSYVIKAHAGPGSLASRLMRAGWVKATYIYRDPRDALLSAFEYGERMRKKGGTNAFSGLESIEDAIGFMKAYVRISDAWLAREDVLHVRYEDLLENYQREAERLVDFLALDIEQKRLDAVLDKYRPGTQGQGKKGLHFVKGKTRRFMKVFSPAQIAMCEEAFGDYLRRRGYA